MRRKVLTERIELRTDKELYRMLKAEATYLGIPLAEVIRKILWGYFEKKKEYKDDEARFQAIMEEVAEEMDRAVFEFIEELKEKRRGVTDEGK